MHGATSLAAVLALAPLGAGPRPAIVAVPPQIVGPQTVMFGSCPLKVTMPGGTSAGPEIPFRAIRLGAAVARNPNSFATGGGGTANAAERDRRMRAGLQYDPIPFDPAAPARLSVFAAERTRVPVPWVYQRLPVLGGNADYGADGMIFAQATSPKSGRIASLALMLAAKPAGRPRLTIAGGLAMPEGCRLDNSVAVYAPAMTAAQLRRLFSRSGCSWTRLADCSHAERPRGRVLFVQKQRGGPLYAYRWVDYDLLAGS